MRIVSGRRLRAGRSRTVNADDGSHCALVSQRFLYLFGRIENFCFFAILAFLEFLTFSRWVSSLKKRFKNHDSQTASPANHQVESFGFSWLLADGTAKASIPLGDVRVDLLDAWQKGVRKFGPAPRGPLEREAAGLLTQMRWK